MIRTLVLREPLSCRTYLELQADLRQRREELLLVCEHLPVITGGVKFQEKSLRSNPASLGVDFLVTGRGGDATAHEPGQVIFYPHVDLKKRDISISVFFSQLLESVKRGLQIVCGIDTESRPDAPGLYAAEAGGAKIASIGVQFKGFFTSHGIAVNFDNSLETFGLIHPCGDANLSVTSAKALGKAGNKGLFIDVVLQDLRKHFDTQTAGNSSDHLGPGSSVGRAAD